MAEQQGITNDSNAEGEGESSKGLGKMGKIFLIAGIVLVQLPLAYLIIDSYYPDLAQMTMSEEPKPSTFYKFKDVVINPAKSNGLRYLVFSLTVELKGQKALNALKKHKAEATESVNRVMEGYTAEELATLKNRQMIKKKLSIVLNDIINKKSVRNLFFTKYILQ